MRTSGDAVWTDLTGALGSLPGPVTTLRAGAPRAPARAPLTRVRMGTRGSLQRVGDGAASPEIQMWTRVWCLPGRHQQRFRLGKTLQAARRHVLDLCVLMAYEVSSGEPRCEGETPRPLGRGNSLPLLQASEVGGWCEIQGRTQVKLFFFFGGVVVFIIVQCFLFKILFIF